MRCTSVSTDMISLVKLTASSKLFIKLVENEVWLLDTNSVSDEDEDELDSSTLDEFIVVCKDLHSRTRAPGCVAIRLFTFNASLTMCIEQIYSIIASK